MASVVWSDISLISAALAMAIVLAALVVTSVVMSFL